MKNVGAYIWNFTAKFGTQVLWLVTTMILARYLTPDDFGTIGILSILFLVANTLTESGLGGALVIQKELLKSDCSTISVFNIVVSTSIYAIVFVCANRIEAFYNVDNLATLTRVISLVFVIGSFGIVPRTILFHQLRFKELCIISLSSVILGAVCAILLAFNNAGVYSLVAYQLVQVTANTIGCIGVSKYKFSLQFSTASFKKLFSFGFYTTITGVVDTIYENIMAAIFGKYLNVTQAGYLSQAKRIEEASSQSLLMTVNGTAFPILAKYKDDIDSFKKEAISIQTFFSYLLFPLLMILCVFSKEVILLLFGSQWIDASQYLSVLVIASLFLIMDSISRNFIKSLGRVEILFKATMLKRVIGCLLMVIFGLYSVQYILFAYVISAFIGVIINSISYSRIIKENMIHVLLDLFAPLMYVAPIALSMYLVRCYIQNIYINVALCSGVMALYYFIFLPYKGINIISVVSNLINKKNI